MTGATGHHESDENHDDSDPGSENGGGFLQQSGLQEAAADDPLFLWFQDHWRQVVVLIVAVVLAYLARDAYLRTYTNTMRGAADVFSYTREQFGGLRALEEQLEQAKTAQAEQAGSEETRVPEGEKKDKEDEVARLTKERDELVARLRENLVALEQENEPYRTLGHLYRGMLEVEVGDREKAAVALQNISPDAASGASADKLFEEIGQLNLARAELDSEESLASGKKRLQELARSAVFAHVSAAVALARVAETEEERSEARSLLEELALKHPEQSDLLEDEIDRIGQ